MFENTLQNDLQKYVSHTYHKAKYGPFRIKEKKCQDTNQEFPEKNKIEFNVYAQLLDT